jgi:hypothetical protein
MRNNFPRSRSGVDKLLEETCGVDRGATLSPERCFSSIGLEWVPDQARQAGARLDEATEGLASMAGAASKMFQYTPMWTLASPFQLSRGKDVNAG